MSTRLLALTTLMILFGLQVVFVVSKKEYDGRSLLVLQNQHLQKKLDEQKAKTDVARYQLESFKQEVAMNLPKNIPQQAYRIRNIASVVESSDSRVAALPVDLAFKQIKSEFLKKNYEKTSQDLQRFISDFPESDHVLEAYYLFISSLYEISQYERCLSAINVIVEQYPDSEMTGLSLLIMGQIFEKQERYDEAKDIYQTVIRNFPYVELKEKAQNKLSEIQI